MPTSVVLVLIVGAFVLASLAVVVDRLNFPQRRFVPRQVAVDEAAEATRDRTGAHIVDEGDEAPASEVRPRPNG